MRCEIAVIKQPHLARWGSLSYVMQMSGNPTKPRRISLRAIDHEAAARPASILPSIVAGLAGA
jgi:hypothetical protein